MPRPDTRANILRIATTLVAEKGLDQLSFDAIAAGLGKSKQAVLYWFPTKGDLLTALFLPALQAEADAVVTALGEARGKAAVARALRALAHFHLADLARFRLMYLLPQTIRQGTATATDRPLMAEINRTTDRLYAALAEALGGADPAARQGAASLHAATLGVVLMLALAERVQDPLKHSPDEMIDALVTRLGLL